jgi:predicted nucleotidyltransferase
VTVESFLDEITSWATTRTDIVGIALVGSRARGNSRPDSDVDLVVLCASPARLLGENWPSRFGEIESSALEDYGALQSLRIFYRRGLEVELGVAGRAWARIPLDPGTKAILADGVHVLHDPEELLRAARDVAAN